MVSDRAESTRQRAQLVLTLGLLAGFLLVLFGLIQVFRLSAQDGLPIVGLGAVLVVFSLGFYLMVTILAKVESSAYRLDQAIDQIEQTVRTLGHPLQTLAAEAEISDGTRSVIHRNKEREALRNAARADIVKGDWEMAYFIIDQMERRFGLREEAASLRSELEQARQDTIELKIDEALNHIRRLFDAHEWERAQTEISRLARLLPDNEQVRSLPQQLQAARERHKQELLAEWDAAVARNDVDRGIEILRALDAYLTKEEAAKLADSARGVFKARLVNLGVQFGLAVSEQRWRDALEVGLQITDEFPNSRMAREVEQNLDTLRRRAGLVADVTMGPTSPEPPNVQGPPDAQS